MKSYTTLAAASLMMLSANAQTYHSDALVNGVQTLKIQGNLLLEQYNNGFGGDLNVPGDSNLSTGASVLPMPAGVSGFYHGPVKFGGSTTIGEYRFEKLGDEISGDFVVPLGLFHSYGSGINIDVMLSAGDPNSGGASFSIFGKTHRELAKVTAVSHSAFGGGCGIKLHALNAHGFVFIYLQFDALNYGAGGLINHVVTVRTTNFGACYPMDRSYTFEQMFPVVVASSLVGPHMIPSHYNSVVGPTTQFLNADNTVVGGKMVISVPQGDISMGIYGGN